MKSKTRAPEQDDLLRPRLSDMIDTRHELVRLEALIDWDFFEREWAGFFPSHTGRPATPPRLVAGLLYLQHAYGLSDEAVVARWVENPYFQHFCGETFFQHAPPIDPSSLTRWRGRIGEEGVEWLLTKTIEAGREAGAIRARSGEAVIVDTTVMEKAIAHPTDARLYERARLRLVKLAREAGLSLRQSYARLAPRLAAKVGRYAHARQFKRMRNGVRRTSAQSGGLCARRTRLKGYTGRVLRDIQRKLEAVTDVALRDRMEGRTLVDRLLRQKPKDKRKLYALHEPEVDCISKGKARASATSSAPRSRWQRRTAKASSWACARCPVTPTTATPSARRSSRSRSLRAPGRGAPSSTAATAVTACRTRRSSFPASAAA